MPLQLGDDNLIEFPGCFVEEAALVVEHLRDARRPRQRKVPGEALVPGLYGGGERVQRDDGMAG